MSFNIIGINRSIGWPMLSGSGRERPRAEMWKGGLRVLTGTWLHYCTTRILHAWSPLGCTSSWWCSPTFSLLWCLLRYSSSHSGDAREVFAVLMALEVPLGTTMVALEAKNHGDGPHPRYSSNHSGDAREVLVVLMALEVPLGTTTTMVALEAKNHGAGPHPQPSKQPLQQSSWHWCQTMSLQPCIEVMWCDQY